MTSPLAGPPDLRGSQTPSALWVPPYVDSSGAEAVELARNAGLVLDPWQEFVLDRSLGEKANGKWAAFEVGLVVPRQNGKGSILEARELAGLFLLGERLIIHSAHQFDTSLEAFRRLLFLIEENPDFDRRVKRVSRSHGEEGIELKNGQRIRFRTRTKGGGRGFTSDCLILDEAMDLPEATHGALFPTLSARPNPQVWYTGSAVDQQVHEHGVVLARIRKRGLAGGDPALAFFEWAADGEAIEADPGLASDPAQWAKANPGLGIRISVEHVEKEQRSMERRTFAAERLSIGDWPDTDVTDGRIISRDVWHGCADPGSQITGTPFFAVDVTPNRGFGSIAVGGARSDDRWHVEVVEHRAGTGWIVGRCAEIQGKNPGSSFLVDVRSPAAALISALVDAGVEVVEVSAQEYSRACGLFFDSVNESSLRFPAPQPELSAAVAGAATRPLGDAWAWSRRSSSTDISPLVAATLVLWAASTDDSGDILF